MMKGRPVTVALLAVGVAVLVWAGSVRPQNGEVQQISQTPLAGPYLAPLESIQPVLFHARLNLAGKIREVVFRGVTSQDNVGEFARVHKLVRVTNEVDRTRILSKLDEWNLDSVRFPIFNGAKDLCFTGWLDNNKLLVQIAHRPGDDRFTGLVISNAVNTAALQRN